ncbi:MAG: hypothetical protein LRY73_07970 [Bacillus sp. (in: Bacteria)]|nr:hypothetical protein [Bacillus sp. (in: firmicutes)]
MHELLSTVAEKIRGSSHIKELLAEADLSVCFVAEEERWLMVFSEGHVNLDYQANGNSDVVVEGDMEALRLLLRGDDFLLSMKKRGELKAEGSLKNLLLLESILYLSKKV